MNIKLKKNGQLFKFLDRWGFNGWEYDLCAVVQTLIIVPFALILGGIVAAGLVLPPLVVIAVAIFGDISHLSEWVLVIGAFEIFIYLFFGTGAVLCLWVSKVSTSKVIRAYIASRKEKYCAKVEWE